MANVFDGKRRECHILPPLTSAAPVRLRPNRGDFRFVEGSAVRFIDETSQACRKEGACT